MSWDKRKVCVNSLVTSREVNIRTLQNSKRSTRFRYVTYVKGKKNVCTFVKICFCRLWNFWHPFLFFEYTKRRKYITKISLQCVKFTFNHINVNRGLRFKNETLVCDYFQVLIYPCPYTLHANNC